MAAEENTPPSTTEATKPDVSVETPTKPAADQLDGADDPLANTELEVEVKLADLQADPDNPLYSAKTFEEPQLSQVQPKMQPRDGSKEAKKAEASKAKNSDHITLEQFLKETEEGEVTSGDCAHNTDATTKDGAGKVDDGK
ncbi:RNA helicase required for poly(A+) mRNA export [Didymosphaeria variabile]|uniref:RNA helicase required for poly(A+) mRNA export n=1 Tax=Didymosphaeria variabile TaxID=1932322 RepID=A0A9W8XA33_9PLEO|nr:RNA helicase required for poly(A+) mRNA export [Didymosphaeria variabile]KAJ4344780.1 RNA helicase required for poly(A+) mRNA export [Didymosphaeria variabile]